VWSGACRLGRCVGATARDSINSSAPRTSSPWFVNHNPGVGVNSASGIRLPAFHKRKEASGQTCDVRRSWLAAGRPPGRIDVTVAIPRVRVNAPRYVVRPFPVSLS
jgi:hypothetical protein